MVNPTAKNIKVYEYAFRIVKLIILEMIAIYLNISIPFKLFLFL